MAASLPGVTLIPGLDGAPDGFSVLGLGADQNTTTLNGMSFNSGSLPRDANISSSLTTSPYDGSRGGFSGANFNIRPGSGSNFRTRGMSLVFNTPGLEWTDRAAQAVGTRVHERVARRHFLRADLVQQGVLQHLVSAWTPVARQPDAAQYEPARVADGRRRVRFGVASSSTSCALRGRADGRRRPPHRPRERQRLASSAASTSHPPTSTSGQAFGITFNGNWGAAESGRRRRDAARVGERRPVQLDRRRPGAEQRLPRHHAQRDAGRRERIAQLRNALSRPAVGQRARELRARRRRERRARALAFGGNQYLSSSSRTVPTSFQNTLSWFDNAQQAPHQAQHRARLQRQHAGPVVEPARNVRLQFARRSRRGHAGIVHANAHGAPALDRTVHRRAWRSAIRTVARRICRSSTACASTASHFTAAPAFNPDIESAFGRRNDWVPSPIVLSPRIGFSWTLGTAHGDRRVHRRGAHAARGACAAASAFLPTTPSSGLIGSALDNTGLPTGAQQIACIGPAAPTPDWAAYAIESVGRFPASAPTARSAPSSPTRRPNVTVFARNFTPQRSVRSNVSWNGSILDARYSASVDGTYSVNLNQQRSFDLNFKPTTRFTLDDEGRPVFADAANIVPTTGSIASRDARVSSAFARVTEIRSDLQSRSSQVTLRLSPIHARADALRLERGVHVHAHPRAGVRLQQHGGQSARRRLGDVGPGAAPDHVQSALQPLRRRAGDVERLSSARGARYTPTIAGDVNGDGYFNDRAFIYSPTTTADTALANGMQQLLANATPRDARLPRAADRHDRRRATAAERRGAPTRRSASRSTARSSACRSARTSRSRSPIRSARRTSR